MWFANNFVSWISSWFYWWDRYWLVALHENLNNALMQLYLFLMNLTGTPSNWNLRLDSKQLVSAFLQDALSNKMTWCCQAGRHCFCRTTFRLARSFAIMSLPTTRRTGVWSSITARFQTTTRVSMWKLEKNFQGRAAFISMCVCVFNVQIAML